MASKDRGAWLDPLNRLIWQAAFKEKRTEVTLRNGDKYVIEYPAHRPGKVWARPENKFDWAKPCGWFDLQVVTNPTWVREGLSDDADGFFKWLTKAAQANTIHDGIKIVANVDAYTNTQLERVILLWESTQAHQSQAA